MKLEEHDTVKVVLQMLYLLYTISSKTKSSNNQDLVNELLAIYHILGCNMSVTAGNTGGKRGFNAI